jgi:signal transduction histidine kinase
VKLRWPRRVPLDRGVLGVLLLGALYLVVVGEIANNALVRIAESTNRVRRTHAMLRRMEEAFTLVAEAETSARGYLVTGNESQLAIVTRADTAIARHLDALRELAAGDATRLAQQSELAGLVARRLDMLEADVAARRTKGAPMAANQARTSEGEQLTGAIRETVDRMTTEDLSNLSVQSADEAADLRRAFLWLAGSFMAAFSLVGASLVTVRRDLALRAKAAEEARRARAAAETANRAKSEFLARMSHELRTPLNAVIGFSKVLLARAPTSAEAMQDRLYLQQILSGGTHLLGLVNDLLDLSKVEAGRMAVEREDVEVNALVTDIVASFQTRVAELPVALEANLPEGTAFVETDRTKLRQILTNLIDNALKFTHEGSVTVGVSVDDATRRLTSIAVRDTGIGIDERRRDAIFEAFEQAETGTSRRYGGTGLGLAIARSYCELLGYQLQVDSRLGVGSTFTILVAPSRKPQSGGHPVVNEPS